MLGKPKIRAGEQITCEKGHLICRAAEDIFTGTPVELDWFDGWDEQQAGRRLETAYDPILPCAICGALWMARSLHGSVTLFVGGEWRR